MLEQHNEILADRLNEQPTIFRGCSSQELVTIAWVSAVIWIPICVMLSSMLGYAMVGFSLGAIGVGCTVFVTATIFQKLKRGKPFGYYQQLFACFLEDKHIWRSKFIRKTGVWSLGRTERKIR